MAWAQLLLERGPDSPRMGAPSRGALLGHSPWLPDPAAGPAVAVASLGLSWRRPEGQGRTWA